MQEGQSVASVSKNEKKPYWEEHFNAHVLCVKKTGRQLQES